MGIEAVWGRLVDGAPGGLSIIKAVWVLLVLSFKFNLSPDGPRYPWFLVGRLGRAFTLIVVPGACETGRGT